MKLLQGEPKVLNALPAAAIMRLAEAVKDIKVDVPKEHKNSSGIADPHLVAVAIDEQSESFKDVYALVTAGGNDFQVWNVYKGQLDIERGYVMIWRQSKKLEGLGDIKPFPQFFIEYSNCNITKA